MKIKSLKLEVKKSSLTSNRVAPHLSESEQLKKYAEITKQKTLTSQGELDPNNHPAPEVLSWCKEQGDIIVLDDGSILAAHPMSRTVQNCKIVMLHKGIRPGRVIGATSALIQILMEAAQEAQIGIGKLSPEMVSAQQQRLRVLVREAIADDASDIHIEVRQDIARIRFRRHGEMYLQAEWLPKLAREISSVAFNKETDYAVTHFNPLVPQNASMPLFVDGQNIRLRLSSMPAHGGFDVVLRILTAGDEKLHTLQELGYTNEQVDLIEKAVHMPHGGIIVSGPTGSGKTTTLASCINMISTDRKIYTIEDPVEKVIDKATQIPVNEEQEDRTFASLGRASLRMDPDVIVLGEMRDQGTAEVMARASMTGHLVFSTLHTNTSTGIISRLVDIGISSSLLSDTSLLICLISQRLMPVLCDKCAVSITESREHKPHIERLRAVFGSDLSHLRARGKFCNKCKGLGISGRTVIAEIIWVDEASRYFIQKEDTVGWEKYLKESGWQPITTHALNLVKQGICDPLDAEKIVGNLNISLSGKTFDYKKRS